jgi:hypothetical protein
MKNLFKTKQKGYAILFTMVIVGIISTIALGLASISYKQLVLSSVAKDSQVSFYQADMASECALYVENKMGRVESLLELSGDSFYCGIDSESNQIFLKASQIDSLPKYQINFIGNKINLPCFKIEIDKSSGTGITIRSKGYNICYENNLRTVEREIQISSN